MSAGGLFRLGFEVRGKVQGVSFRKCTREAAQRLGVAGWCRNTPRGSVEGELQGSAEQLDEMERWLRQTGSPASRIDSCEFSAREPLASPAFAAFNVER